MRSFLKNKIHLFFFIMLLMCGIILRVYWSTQREGFHVDEIATFSIAEYDGAYIDSAFNVQATGEELKRYFYIHDASFGGALKDVRSLWHDASDKYHTNFYYSIVRLFFVGMDTIDIRPIIFRGTLLNLLFFIISYLLFFKLLLLYWFDRPIQVFAALACFATMVGGVENTLFIRTYELQMLSVLAMAYWLSKIHISLSDGTWKFNARVFIITAVLLALMLMTGYLMLVLTAVFGLFLLWKLYRTGHFVSGTVFFVASFICALLLCRILYQNYFLGFEGDQRVTDKFMTEGFAARMWESSVAWLGLIKRKTLYLPVLVLVLPVLAFYRKRIVHVPAVLVPALVYSFIVMMLAPYKVNRYLVAVSPMLLLVIPMAIDCMKYRTPRLIMAIVVVSVYFAMPLCVDHLDFIYKKNAPTELLADRSCKIHIIQEDRWRLLWLLSFMDDDIVYDISDDVMKCDIQQGDLVFSVAEMSDTLWNLTFLGKYQYDYFAYRVGPPHASGTQ